MNPQDSKQTSHPFDGLTPEVILNAVDGQGFRSDGRFLALNSYENRVYQIGLEEAAPLVAKFYRPGRWSDEAILEEHAFALELAAQEIPVVAPLERDGRTLFEHDGFRFALFPRRGGRWPDLAQAGDRQWLGRFLGRIHAVGASRPFRHRPRLDVERFALQPSQDLLAHGWLPSHIETAYGTVVEELIQAIRAAFAQAGAVHMIRIHGDCHPGNILWTDAGPHFVDLDDCCTGPAVQDLWMLLSGERDERSRQLSDILGGYEDFAAFDLRELLLVEALRSMRLIHYAGWLARRWDDPAFPRAFPWFGEARYWEEHVLALREQLAALQEPPLVV